MVNGMTKGSTPDFTLTVGTNTLDLSQQSHVYATVKQGNTTVTKKDTDLSISGNVVTFSLTQEESLKFAQGEGEVQVNWTYDNGKRGQSKVAIFPIERTLLPEVLE